MQRQSGSYHAQNENRVIHDVQECSRSFPSLHPILSNFEAADGNVQRLLALRGTVPITYKGSVYKIPVHMWVMPYHPAGPPLAFVVPTRTMVFRQRHPHVDSLNGRVYMPYLSSWDALTSTILGTVNAMIQVFSIKPPVYSHQTPSVSTQEDYERQLLIRELSQRFNTALSRNTFTARRTIQRMVAKQEALKQEESALQTKKREVLREKADLETTERHVRQAVHDLRRWRTQHPDAPTGASIDGMTRPRTLFREQLIDCSALDAAQTEALDQIDEAFATGVIQNEKYVLDVRKIARQQFFTRALQRRVQQQIAVTEPEEEATTLVPPQQPAPIQASTHSRQPVSTPVHATYRPRVGN